METFFTTSENIQHIIKSFNLTKTLFVSSILIGEARTGKKSLARHLFPHAHLVSCKNQKSVEEALEEYDEIILTDFELLSNPSALNFNNKRIIATANFEGNSTLIDDLFAFIYTMPSLQERPKDVEYLKTLFVNNACKTLQIDKTTIDKNMIPVDISTNTQSLKKSIYLYLTKLTMTQEDIAALSYAYFLEHLEGNDGYRQHLSLYEKPLIEAGLKKFGSQLQLSQILGINRNTLRKKIHEHNIH
ncbi:MAG: Fis family transcriptional regulator [uncultured Sulfurovum sp.]|uniref:Fis family transcriptional regulator n=1 Tax=uncultured Sulfurovum sp. TaxID=269237 RepID=A0A6S6U101_9BACT|nr:MAG: Fis family transcriptional regulator [uncultured Sulfurovum sp.]